jgi:hypothetical protein
VDGNIQYLNQAQVIVEQHLATTGLTGRVYNLASPVDQVNVGTFRNILNNQTRLFDNQTQLFTQPLINNSLTIDNARGFEFKPGVTQRINYSGELNNTNIGYSVAQADSGDYILMGNPYAAGINFTSGISKTNIKPMYWVNAGFGNYAFYDVNTGLGTMGLTENLASGQGFFVQAAADGPVQADFLSSLRFHNQLQPLVRTAPLVNFSYLVKMQLMQNNQVIDELFIGQNVQGNASSSLGKDEVDILDFMPDEPRITQFVMRAQGDNYTLANLPYNQVGVVGRLGFYVRNAGSLTIKTELLNADNTNLALRLTRKNQQYLLTSGATLLEPTTNLTFLQSGLDTSVVVSFDINNNIAEQYTTGNLNAFYANGNINIQLPEVMAGNLELMDLSGKMLLSNKVGETASYSQTIDLPVGTYFVRFVSGNKIYRTRLLIGR